MIAFMVASGSSLLGDPSCHKGASLLGDPGIIFVSQGGISVGRSSDYFCVTRAGHLCWEILDV